MLIDVNMDVDSLWSVPESGIKRRASRRSDTAPGFTNSLWLNHSRPASEARRRSLSLSSSPLFDIVLGQWIRKGNESLSASLRKLSLLNYFSLLWWAWKMLFWSQYNLSWINPSQNVCLLCKQTEYNQTVSCKCLLLIIRRINSKHNILGKAHQRFCKQSFSA